MSMPKLAADAANNVLTRLDNIASVIQSNYEGWGMPFEAAKDLVNALDTTADEIEAGSFGKESFLKRQAEVIEKESDEGYMGTFAVNPSPIQVESDEPYMKLYGSPDQSSAVRHGKSTTGHPLT